MILRWKVSLHADNLCYTWLTSSQCIFIKWKHNGNSHTWMGSHQALNWIKFIKSATVNSFQYTFNLWDYWLINTLTLLVKKFKAMAINGWTIFWCNPFSHLQSHRSSMFCYTSLVRWWLYYVLRTTCLLCVTESHHIW